MKTDLNFLQRAFLANLARVRVLSLLDAQQTTIAEKQKVELAEEIHYAKTLANALDAGEELVVERPAPVIANPRLDIDSIDGTARKSTNGGERRAD